ncbi:hypothetical protein N7455_001429 [Penicillium solitum]|uniref:uncharacterized protein n=1 Tax=Penicillium solitum TaxID=60172 RepID=UPI0032C3FD2A|nr:hypothetical protein N7455_001429 [Penicillium solitum]
MQLRPVSHIWVFLSALIICQAAWVRKFPCGSNEKYDSLESPFRIDSLHGTLETFDDSTVLSLSILAIHDVEYFKCSDLDLPRLEDSLGFHALGVPTGVVLNFSSNCPLPITTTLTPPEGSLFSNLEILYSFTHAHRLQTIVAEISFNTQDGVVLDCAAPKITPDIGTAASRAFTYFPVAVMALVAIASWTTNCKDVSGWSSIFENRAAQSLFGPVWTVVLELSDYIRYLQFMFLAGSLTLEYPGFYQPIISQAAWSSLLYWTGPIDHGFTYTGVEDGMYVSNRSYGLEYMSQMIGFPQMPDIMVDAFINLLILVFAVLVGFLMLFLALSQLGRGFQLSLVSWNAGFVLFGMILSFFSLPLLSYLSDELILIGYLPNYRIILVGLSMAMVVYANFLITRHAIAQKDSGDQTSPGPFFPQRRSTRYVIRACQCSAQYLPAAVPLLQGIVIGGLQDWGRSQVLVLMGIEIFLLIHLVVSLGGPDYRSSIEKNGRASTTKGLPAVDPCDDFAFLGGPSSPLDGLEGSAGSFPTIPNYTRHYITDFSVFYRQPRHSYAPRTFHHEPSSLSGAPEISNEGPRGTLCSDAISSTESPDSCDELMEDTTRPGVDYSVRESDAYYGAWAHRLSSPIPPSFKGAEESQEDQSALRDWSTWTAKMFKRPKKKEKGFQVMRPPRPAL